MIVPTDMDVIRKIATHLEEAIKALEKELEKTKCQDKLSDLQNEIRAKRLTLFGYQRTLSSLKYSG
ncbi:MAG: hypothetical protein FWD03_00100 [Defluviitaleaceae bacterium]|nr:hypothetical protein [Defluviitaleaceae bacterium]